MIECRGLFSEEDEVEITCWDRDRMSSNDVLGHVTIPLRDFALPFMVGVCYSLIYFR